MFKTFLDSVLLFLSTAIDSTASDSKCPPGYQLFEQRCLQCNRAMQTWAAAKSSCEQQNASLVTIVSLLQVKFLENCVPSDSWIGLRRPNQGISFAIGFDSWVDGTYAQFINWDPNDSVSTRHNCVMMLKKGGQWQTASCSTMKAYVCEHEMLPWIFLVFRVIFCRYWISCF